MFVYFLIAIVGSALLPTMTRRLPATQRRMVAVAYAAHMLAAAAQYWVVQYYYEGGDMLAYHRHGEVVAGLMHRDLGRFGPATVRLVLNLDAPDLRFGGSTFFAGTATGAMIGIASLLYFALGGSLLATCGLVALASFASKFILFRAMASQFSADAHRWVLAGTLLVPSVVFWTSGLAKEAIAMIGIGPLLWGLVALSRRSYLPAAISIGLGALFIYVVKPYVLFAAVASLGATAALEVVRRRRGGISTGRALLGLAVLLAGFIALGRAFPRYDIAQVTDQLARLQSIGARTSGGSNYALLDPSSSVGVQIATAPLALATTLFRPLIIEVRNPLMLVSALENLALLVLAVRAFRPRQKPVQQILAQPKLTAMAVFVIVFGVVVGLASTNLGTLSRYRVPLVPFFALLLADLLRRRSVRQSTPLNRAPRRRVRA